MSKIMRPAMAGLLTLVSLTSPPAVRADGGSGSKDLAQSSLEELMNIEVTSVSRKDQRLSQVAAAVFVITQEDIRRSGMTSIPEALRLAPGVDVARIDGSKWAITSRGFNGRFANKMLVLIDGRSVYSNLYAGVYWDQNDVLLDDVERIEVIRGPGAAMWGANAVNGVINVITKTAEATQGLLVTTGAGTDDLASGAIRYGGKAGDKIHYRAYAKSSLTNDSATATGGNAGDRWNETRGGGRLDWDVSARDSLTFHGDGYQGNAGQTYGTNFPLFQFGTLVRDRLSFGGGYGLARWTHRGKNGSEFALQGYFNREDRDEGPGVGHFRTIDFDFQHRIRAGSRHDLTWGLGYRRMSDSIVGHVAIFVPVSRADNLYSSFLQDDISLIEDRLTLSLGSKFQHNNYSGFEFQPSARLLWAPTPQRSFWAAVSRAARTPSRRDTDVRLEFLIPQTNGSTYTGLIAGSASGHSEIEQAFEAGFRTQATKYLSVDVATFYSRYHDLQSWEYLSPQVDMSTGAPEVIIPITFANGRNAHTYGMETSLTWAVTQTWKLSGAYSWLRYHSADTPDPSGFSEDNSPQHQVHVRSSLDLTPRISLDGTVFYVGELAKLSVPAYVRVDARLGYKFSKNVELSIGGRNLLDERHVEFKPEDQVRNAEIRRSAWLRLTFAF